MGGLRDPLVCHNPQFEKPWPTKQVGLWPNKTLQHNELGDGPPLPRGRHSLGAYTNIRYCSAGVYKDDAVRLKYLYPQLELDRCYI